MLLMSLMRLMCLVCIDYAANFGWHHAFVLSGRSLFGLLQLQNVVQLIT